MTTVATALANQSLARRLRPKVGQLATVAGRVCDLLPARLAEASDSGGE